MQGCTARRRSRFENNYFTKMCSGSEAGSYLRLIYFVYHSTLGLRVTKKKKKACRKKTKQEVGEVRTLARTSPSPPIASREI